MFEQKRMQMVERLRAAGIGEEVLNAMQKVPREKFVAAGMEFQAYDEKALPIGFGQTISHPFTVAVMSQILQVRKNDKILEIGTGCGYQSAVLLELGAQVFSVEIQTGLARRARQTLEGLGYKLVIRSGDGSNGWQTYAPFNAVIVTAGAPIVEKSLLQQLTDPGRLLIPVGDKETQKLTLFELENGKVKKTEIMDLQFVPLTGKKGWK